MTERLRALIQGKIFSNTYSAQIGMNLRLSLAKNEESRPGRR
jgi:hypothetical protein